ncbi:phage minor head protein, partial [Gemmatimonas sp.]|uniref:phage minor head protein n=1 Tax=Gemmatimonas sp. TaxID=1962908 RepID=UPI003565A69D
AALQSQKVGQQLAWQEAQRAGTLDGVEVVRRWVATIDGRERDEHREMDGAEAPLDGVYRNGQTYPGEGEYNCRCTEIIRVARPAFALSA